MSSNHPSSNGILSRWHRFQQAHEQLKNSVHSYWRQNTILSPRGTAGKVVMSCVYFSIPVIVGYSLFTAVVERSEPSVQKRLMGDSSEDKGILYPLEQRDQTTQEINRINLERFLKKQRKRKEQNRHNESDRNGGDEH